MVAPLAALVTAVFSGEPLLAHWTQTFMGGAARFVSQWFPLFLLGGLFGKLMGDSGSISSIAQYLTTKLGTSRTMLAVVIASAIVTYGGVSVFVAFFVLVPMAHEMFRAANLPRRLLPATIGLGAFTFTMSVMPGTPSVNNAIPMPYFGTTTFAAPGLSIIASAIIFVFGMWWLARAEAAARKAGEGYGGDGGIAPVIDEMVREQAAPAGDFDPAELPHGKRAESGPPFALAVLPLVVVIIMNFFMSLVVFPRLDFSFLSEPQWGGTTIGAVSGLWSVVVALAAANLTVIARQLSTLAIPPRKSRRGCEFCGLADADDRQSRRLRRGRCRVACICIGSRCGILDSGRAAGLVGCLHECAGGADRYCFGRYGNRTQCIWRRLFASRR